MISIRSKLLLALLIPLVIVAALVSIETFYSSRKISNDLGDKTLLAASLTILERVIATDGNLLAEETLKSLTENLGDRFFYHVSGPNGAFVTGYSGYPRPPENAQQLVENIPIFYDSVHLGKPVRVVHIKRDFSERELSGITAITTWQRVTQRRDLTIELFARSLARLFMLVAAAGTIVWFAVQFGLRPLTNLQSAIDRRTPYDLTQIKRTMPKELSGIVNSMNDLFARVARSKSNRERFIGDAAHQLRNPIAAIKIQAETALESGKKSDMQKSLDQIVDVSNSSASMINKMLSGATAHALDEQMKSKFCLTDVVAQAVGDLAPKAFDQNRELSVSGCETPVCFFGNDTLLKEAVTNLIDNSIRHTQPGSPIEVGILKHGGNLEVFVADCGTALTEEQFLKLTQPFYTRNDTATGSGLGLSITKDIAKSHGGYLISAATQNGKKISILLPENSAPLSMHQSN